MARKGFTLIELLVVISIIGMLSAVVLASLNTARAKAQDAARISNVKSLKTAMELYYSSNGTYPQAGGQNAGTVIATLSSYLVPGYVGSIAPILTSDGDWYVWCGSGACANAGQGYSLWVYTSQYGWCQTGVNMNPNWWVLNAPTCPF